MKIRIHNIQDISKHVLSSRSLINIVAIDDKIYLQSNDIEFSLRENVNGEVIKNGSVAVNASLLYKLSRSRGRRSIELESSENTLKIDSDASIPISSVEIYKLQNTANKSVTFKSDIIIEFLSLSKKCTSMNILNGGILFSNKYIVSTDTYRLLSIELNQESECDFIIPHKSVVEILKLSKLSEYITIEYGNNLFIKVGNVEFSSRVIESSQFPAYKHLLSGYKDYFEIDGALFKEIVQEIGIISDKMQVHILEDSILFCGRSQNGEIKRQIDIKKNCNIKFVVNVNHILDAIHTGVIIRVYFGNDCIMIEYSLNTLSYKTVLMPCS